MNETLTTNLRKLRLSGLAQSLEVRLHEAQSHQLSHGEFLELILQDELAVRTDRQIERRTRAAMFRDQRTLEDFDFAFNPSIKRKQVYDLASGAFVRQGRDVLLLGPPGTGKSHLVQAIGQAVIRSGFTVLYRSIFDVVRDFLHDEAFGGEDKVLGRYLKPELLIIDLCAVPGYVELVGEPTEFLAIRVVELHIIQASLALGSASLVARRRFQCSTNCFRRSTLASHLCPSLAATSKAS